MRVTPRSFSRTALCLLLGAAAASAATALPMTRAGDPLVSAFEFEKDSEGWGSPDPQCHVSVTHDPNLVKIGKGALSWKYDPKQEFLFLTRHDLRVDPTATTLDFWANANQTSVLQLFLKEKDGSQYAMHLRPVAHQWEHYRIPLSDLERGQAREKNHALNLANLEEITFQDLTHYHAPARDLGPRQLVIDSFRLTHEPAPSRRGERKVDGTEELLIDDFDGPVLTWAAGTRTDLQFHVADGRTVLRASYRQGTQSPDRLHLTNQFDPRYSRMQAVKVVARASGRTKLDLALREFLGSYTGPDFHATCELKGGKDWETVVVPLTAFQCKSEPQRPLDLLSVWLFLAEDVTQPESLDSGPVTLEIDSISAVMPR